LRSTRDYTSWYFILWIRSFIIQPIVIDQNFPKQEQLQRVVLQAATTINNSKKESFSWWIRVFYLNKFSVSRTWISLWNATQDIYCGMLLSVVVTVQ
jgi:hypothetical protein